MLIRGFLKVIRPSNKLLLAGDRNGKFIHILAMYKYVFAQLKKAYNYYAVSDTIFLKNESIRIVHECRDVEFENELKRIGIDIHTHMQEMRMPVNHVRKNQSRFYNFFKWDNQLIVYYSYKEIAICRGNNVSIDGTLNSKVLLSLPTDVICRSHLEVQSSYATEDIENKYKTTALKRDGENKSRIFSKEMIHNTRSKSNSASYSSREKETRNIAKQGFEIDTTF